MSEKTLPKNSPSHKVLEPLRSPPADALKKIQAGRLKGKSDINPQWRIDVMNQTWGPCGFGWKYQITKQWLEAGPDNQVAAFCNIEIRYQINGAWSEPIPGTGGSMLIAQESRGPHFSDEAFKMALTDALSVAMKGLGVAAEVYRGNLDGSKYSKPAPAAAKKPTGPPPINSKQLSQAVARIAGGELALVDTINKKFKMTPPQQASLTQAVASFRRKEQELEQEWAENQNTDYDNEPIPGI